MVSILTEPKNALTKQFAKLMAMEGVELEFTPDALRELAAQALKKGTGARALRGLLEKLMLDVMFDVPGNDDIAAREDHAARSCSAKASRSSAGSRTRKRRKFFFVAAEVTRLKTFFIPNFRPGFDEIAQELDARRVLQHTHLFRRRRGDEARFFPQN